MGFQPSLSPDTFLLLQHSGMYPIQFMPGGVISLHPTKRVIRLPDDDSDEGGGQSMWGEVEYPLMWAVREFAPDQFAIGFFNRRKLHIYQGDTLQRYIEVDMNIFGFLVLPDMAQKTQLESAKQSPKYLIAFDNDKYAAIDLEADDE